MADSPSLPAIRERLEAAQAEVERRQRGRPVPPFQQALLRDALALLSLVARLQGERDSARAALQEIRHLTRQAREGEGLSAGDYKIRLAGLALRAASACDSEDTATLPADACVACTYDRGAKVQLCAACAARSALGEEAMPDYLCRKCGFVRVSESETATTAGLRFHALCGYVVKEAPEREPYSPEDHLRNVADNAYAKGEPRAVLDALRQVRAEALEEAAALIETYRVDDYDGVGPMKPEFAAAIRALKGAG